MKQQFQLTITVPKEQCGKRLDKVLTELLIKYSRSCIKEWIIKRLVSINGIIIDKPDKKVLDYDKIIINVESEKVQQNKAQNIFLDIIYEDEDILIINKSSNILVHPGAGHPDNTILNALLYYYPAISNIPRAGIIHRLDKDTTGLMVVAKTMLAQNNLLKKLRLREIIREYEAIVTGNMIAGGLIDRPIARHLVKRTHMCVCEMGKSAITYYRIVKRFRAHTQLRLRLQSGRTHQIRVHMAYINHPIVGDLKYGCWPPRIPKGASDKFIEILRNFKRQALHAISLRFHHPITNIEMEWYAPLPNDMNQLINAIKNDMDKFSKVTYLSTK
ncbi:23S rRNA pseudouridine(1911/1915/1917) synthase RluD [Pantoea sp. Mhis]|uniref:23S rRNA pseudouridine(1911/1915/1917) synthase RluD n=1 Tax=Pantoea sp. Mhis TaxID=2576759 RepID=UPI0013585CEB|nr:23S rRNA pseudouridine(1911/1915/1917) synthase RluD [Pantoea sp. Mhis]MXP56621.1 23S rRNA pseudouridine(1911/1915/1917) synthase RluD [Pantoea sp. Mhis]